jgi:hypothetical protein
LAIFAGKFDFFIGNMSGFQLSGWVSYSSLSAKNSFHFNLHLNFLKSTFSSVISNSPGFTQKFKPLIKTFVIAFESSSLE